jgi:O-antigen ligase
LDVLSGMGILGSAGIAVMIALMGKGAWRHFWNHPDKARLCVMWLSVLITATLGTVCYSRDVIAVAALGTLLVLEGKSSGETPAASIAAFAPAIDEEIEE